MTTSTGTRDQSSGEELANSLSHGLAFMLAVAALPVLVRAGGWSPDLFQRVDAPRLDRQLEEQAVRFLSDRSRNRYDPATNALEVSRIFDWYAEDFRLGHQGIFSLHGLAARFADVLADGEADRARIRSTQVLITYLDYDWRLNDAKVTS